VSNANLPTGPGDRRLRVSRLLSVIGAMAVVAIIGYFVLRDKQAAPTSAEAAPKDIAALFDSIQGNVKTRGVGGLEWKTAEVKVPLRKSDLVRTYPSSSAEIKFFDETRVTVRPDSLITIEETSRDPNATSGKIAWKITSGEINYETSRKDSGSTEAYTPTFRLALEGNSAGTMRVGEGGLTAVAQLSGTANIETKTGEKIRLAANEGLRVDASGKAGAKQVLPDPPAVQTPGDGAGVVSLSEDAPVVVSWSPSAGAAAYRVQVESRSPNGGGVVFDQEGLKGTSVSVPGIEPGEFVIKVAGLTEDGVSGKYSSSGSFRVERSAPVRPTPAAVAPFLTIEAFESRGNVLRLVGKTVPGARLTVNGDAVAVQADGSFSEFVTLPRKSGEQRIVIRSIAPSGGVAEETRTLPPSQ
jgi:hypothetical protein